MNSSDSRMNNGLTDLHDMFFHEQFWVVNESRVPSRIGERDVVTTENNRVREENGGRLRRRKEGKKKSFCFVVVEFELIFCHPCFNVICACTKLFGEVVYFNERGGFLELRVICEKLMIYRMASNDVTERCGVQDKESGPKHRALRQTILELWWWRGWVIHWNE